MHSIFAEFPSLLFLTGVNVKKMAITLYRFRPYLLIKGHSELDIPDIEVLVGKALYWYLVPIFQLLYTLVIADVIWYSLHRLGHTNKWTYSKASRTHQNHAYRINKFKNTSTRNIIGYTFHIHGVDLTIIQLIACSLTNLAMVSPVGFPGYQPDFPLSYLAIPRSRT